MEVKVVKQIMEWNEDVSRQVRDTLSDKKVCLVNVMGSPGAGKTSLITEMINRLRDSFNIGVIEGDIAGSIDLDSLDVLFVENIGNLVCPAEFDIGEDFRVSILSVPEGDDKVEKYPLMFATTNALIINKYDMMPYFDFDDKRVEQNAMDINPKASVFRVSARTGDGLDDFINWLQGKISQKVTLQ